MRKLNKSATDLYKAQFIRGISVKSAFTKLRELLETCAVGESIIVKKEEWNIKTPLAFSVNQFYRRGTSSKRFLVRELVDYSGWLVARKA